LPGLGTAAVSSAEESSEVYLSFTSYDHPQTIYRIDVADGTRQVWEKAPIDIRVPDLEVRQDWCQSKDGTRISMFIVHKADLEIDGKNPTILTGYGGFSIPIAPVFQATLLPWFESGGILVEVNLRGGGEYGDSWHRGGMLDNKENVFDDFIAAAEWLISNRFTTAKRLAISGRSNGGLLTGAVVTRRPDLFGAVICGNPLLDMLRYHRFLMAKYWVPEYGSAEKARQFDYLLKYSPYHNVKDGESYPAVLFTSGENDVRVHPSHARKMAARMQRATASDKAKKPILLWVDRESGHGQGKPLHLRLRDLVDARIFLCWQLGMLPESEG